MANPQDTVNIVVPNVLRDRLASHRLHPRMPLYEVVEEALLVWEERGGWRPFVPAPVGSLPAGAAPGS